MSKGAFLTALLLTASLFCIGCTANRAEISATPTDSMETRYDMSIWLTVHPFAVNPHAMTLRDTYVAELNLKKTERKNVYTVMDAPDLTILSLDFKKVNLRDIKIEIKGDRLFINYTTLDSQDLNDVHVLVFNDEYKITKNDWRKIKN